MLIWKDVVWLGGYLERLEGFGMAGLWDGGAEGWLDLWVVMGMCVAYWYRSQLVRFCCIVWVWSLVSCTAGGCECWVMKEEG